MGGGQADAQPQDGPQVKQSHCGFRHSSSQATRSPPLPPQHHQSKDACCVSVPGPCPSASALGQQPYPCHAPPNPQQMPLSLAVGHADSPSHSNIARAPRKACPYLTAYEQHLVVCGLSVWTVLSDCLTVRTVLSVAPLGPQAKLKLLVQLQFLKHECSLRQQF